jgi:hypothetical protein
MRCFLISIKKGATVQTLWNSNIIDQRYKRRFTVLLLSLLQTPQKLHDVERKYRQNNEVSNTAKKSPL